MLKKPILVTGIHRSGSTFTGQMLSLPGTIAYIQEPFNKDYGLKGIDINFKYLSESNRDANIKKILDDLICLTKADYHIPSLSQPHASVPNRTQLLKEITEGVDAKTLAKLPLRLTFKSKAQLYFCAAKYNPRIDRILIKDPLACLASRYLQHKYQMQVIVLVRHPLSFAGSLKRLGWRFDFKNLLCQQELMDTYLGGYKDAMIKLNTKQTTVVEEACLLWNCIYHVLANYIQENNSFIVTTHEEIARQPQKTFKKLYRKLDLSYTEKIDRKIQEHTSARNPARTRNNKTHQLKRDSASLIYRWEEILTEPEITYIKKATKQVAANYYPVSPFEQ